MRPRRLFGACAALVAAACGSSPGNGLFGGSQDHLPVVGPDAGDPEPGAGGKAAAGSGGRPRSAGGAAGRSAGGTGGVEPTAGGSQGNGGASGSNNPGGAAGKGAAGDTGGSGGGGTPAGGAAGNEAGGSAGQGAGGKLTGSGGSASGATPHTVACGAMACPVGSLTSACCVSDLSIATLCIPTLGAGCANGGTAVTCDDAADCAGSEICCADSVGNLPVTVCAKDCKDGVDQLCRTDDECKSGGGCEPFVDQPAYSHCK